MSTEPAAAVASTSSSGSSVRPDGTPEPDIPGARAGLAGSQPAEATLSWPTTLAATRVSPTPDVDRAGQNRAIVPDLRRSLLASLRRRSVAYVRALDLLVKARAVERPAVCQELRVLAAAGHLTLTPNGQLRLDRDGPSERPVGETT